MCSNGSLDPLLVDDSRSIISLPVDALEDASSEACSYCGNICHTVEPTSSDVCDIPETKWEPGENMMLEVKSDMIEQADSQTAMRQVCKADVD